MEGNITLEKALLELELYSDDIVTNPLDLTDKIVIINIGNKIITLNKKTTFTTLHSYLMSIWVRYLAYPFPMNKREFVRGWKVTNEENLIYPLDYFRLYLRERNLMKLDEN